MRLIRIKSLRVDAQGFSGGLWILWKDTANRVRIVDSGGQFVHIEIENVSKRQMVLYRYLCQPLVFVETQHCFTI